MLLRIVLIACVLAGCDVGEGPPLWDAGLEADAEFYAEPPISIVDILRSRDAGAGAGADASVDGGAHYVDSGLGGDEDAGEPVCDWVDTGDRTIVWCDDTDYFCCTHAELDGPRKHWRPLVCPGYCEEGFVAMEDFHIFGINTTTQALYCVEDRGQCSPDGDAGI